MPNIYKKCKAELRLGYIGHTILSFLLFFLLRMTILSMSISFIEHVNIENLLNHAQ